MAWYGPIAELLDGLGVTYVLAGALAAREYRAEGRFTTDLDLLVTWDERLPAALDEAGYSVRSMADRDSHPHLLMLRGPDLAIDLIVAVVDYQHQAIARGRDGGSLTVEDVIVHKLLAWRLRDKDDIRSILEAGHDLDLAYIDKWVAVWEVGEHWAEARTWPGGPDNTAAG